MDHLEFFFKFWLMPNRCLGKVTKYESGIYSGLATPREKPSGGPLEPPPYTNRVKFFRGPCGPLGPHNNLRYVVDKASPLPYLQDSFGLDLWLQHPTLLGRCRYKSCLDVGRT